MRPTHGQFYLTRFWLSFLLIPLFLAARYYELCAGSVAPIGYVALLMS
jgi:hypothetical protein